MRGAGPNLADPKPIFGVVHTYAYPFFPFHSLSSPSLLPPPPISVRGSQLVYRLFVSPLPTAVRALGFYREEGSPLSSHVDSRLIDCVYYLSTQQLVSFERCNLHTENRTP